jgi:hypothetical protein
MSPFALVVRRRREMLVSRHDILPACGLLLGVLLLFPNLTLYQTLVCTGKRFGSRRVIVTWQRRPSIELIHAVSSRGPLVGIACTHVSLMHVGIRVWLAVLIATYSFVREEHGGG